MEERAIVRGETVLLHRLQSPPSVSLPLLLLPSNSYSLLLFVRIICILCFRFCTSHVLPFPLPYSSPVSSFFVAECFLLPVSLGWSILLIAFSEILKFMYSSPPTFPSLNLSYLSCFHSLPRAVLARFNLFRIFHYSRCSIFCYVPSKGSSFARFLQSPFLFVSLFLFRSSLCFAIGFSEIVSTFVHLRISLKRCLRRRQR